MNKADLREKRRRLQRDNRAYRSGVFVELPMETWPYMDGRQASVARVAAWRSREFLVQAIMERGLLRLSVNRTDLDASGNWKDGITWDELQTIKSAAGYGDRDAVEAYPKNSDVVNVANIRHLWILPNHADLPVFWRKKGVSDE